LRLRVIPSSGDLLKQFENKDQPSFHAALSQANVAPATRPLIDILL
jgi:hypothetical protein